MTKIVRPEIPLNDFLLNNDFITKNFNWKLVREHDNKTAQSEKVMWIEFDENGRFKEKFDIPAVGRSLLMSPFNQAYTWMTTSITSILEEGECFVRFTTKNSEYILTTITKNE